MRMKTSTAFQEKSMAGRDLAKKYVNHHRMGTAGYAGSEPEWEKEDMEAMAAGLKPPFGDIKDKRAKNWARARGECNKDNEFVPTLTRDVDIKAFKDLVRLHKLELIDNYHKKLP